jgi:hypothetical protein
MPKDEETISLDPNLFGIALVLYGTKILYCITLGFLLLPSD